MNNMKKKKNPKRKVNYQKLFCFASFIFILVCIFWYGGRLIYFYQDSKKTITEEATTLARIIKTQNHDNDNFKQVGKDYYFNGDVNNNYVTYSNLLWRIVKVNQDNSIVLITENVIGVLAYGDASQEYSNSNLIHWLNANEEDATSGTFEKILNEKEKYLLKNSTCIDNLDDSQNVTCDETNDDNYLGLLSVYDYIYTGGNNGFINNDRYNYLANKNTDNQIWYINSEGKLDVSSGEDILGFKTTITLSPTLEVKSGAGSLDDPYKFEEASSLIGSYVKLENDMWRIYEENDGIVKLILQDTISNGDAEGSEKIKYSYSKNSYYHNDTSYGSLAYYLNNTYYNNLSYKDLIIENTYVNGFYGSDTDYKYNNIKERTIQTRVAVPSISDILLNDTLDGYFTDTGVSENSSLIYIQKEKGLVTSRNVTAEALIVPCISISKENLKAGSGSNSDPYRTE